MDKKSCLGVILSGGQSTRMGRDKALLQLRKELLITHAVKRLQNQLDSIIINSASRQLPFSKTTLPLVADLPQVAGSGPLGGIFSAMAYAKTNGYQAIITIAVDTPFFPETYARQLIEKARANEGKPIIAATAAAWHPTFGLWPVALEDMLEHHLHTAKEKGIAAFARQQDAQTVLFTPVAPYYIDPFFNINTPADLAEAEALVREIEEKQP